MRSVPFSDGKSSTVPREIEKVLLQGHGGGENDAAVGNDVPIDVLAFERATRKRMALFEAGGVMFLASNAKIHVIALDLLAFPFGAYQRRFLAGSENAANTRSGGTG
jgi:hypothetical protein